MKRLSYLLFSILLFCSCEKPDTNYSIAGEWNLYGVKLHDIAFDTIASNTEITSLRNIINTIHAIEDSTVSDRNISMTFTSDNKYFLNGEEFGTYSFSNNKLSIHQAEQEIVYDSVFLSKNFLSYVVDRTTFFSDSIFLHENGLADTISPNLIQKVRTRFSFKN